jgi:hypothetical protein
LRRLLHGPDATDVNILLEGAERVLFRDAFFLLYPDVLTQE